MSETVERRLLELLDHPTESPYGNPIPGLEELGEVEAATDFLAGVRPLAQVVAGAALPLPVTVRRISEPLQTDERLMAALRRAGAVPGRVVQAQPSPSGVLLGSGGETVEISGETAGHVFVGPL